MKQIHIISPLFLQQGILKSKVNGSAKKVHYKQGELDGACGAYSIAMALNIVGAFDADFITTETPYVDFRTAEGKLHKAIHDWGLYPNGLSVDNCSKILDSYKKYVSYEVLEGIDNIKQSLDSNLPVVLGIDYSGGGHWIVAVGYELKDDQILNIYTLDPGSILPVSAYWNGVICLKKEKGKKYCYDYDSVDWSTKVKLTEAIVIQRK